MDIIDFHTHVFPDRLAEKTIPALAASGNVTPALNGKLASLLGSMDRAGIATSVVCSIATRPTQFEAILAWSQELDGGRIVAFPSIHPEDPDALTRVAQIKAAGFKGIKMHPYYQDFFLDDPRLWPLYERICTEELILVMHTGFDIAFPRTRRADPAAILRTVHRFPGLKLVATHLGAWDQWDEVEKILIGAPLYMDISFSLPHLDPALARRLLTNHSPDHLLFGSDSPWADQLQALQQLNALALNEDLTRKILRDNARILLASV